MDKQIEIQNRINQVEASIDQMKNSELFSEAEKTDSVKRLNQELEKLQSLKVNNIEVKDNMRKQYLNTYQDLEPLLKISETTFYDKPKSKFHK